MLQYFYSSFNQSYHILILQIINGQLGQHAVEHVEMDEDRNDVPKEVFSRKCSYNYKSFQLSYQVLFLFYRSQCVSNKYKYEYCNRNPCPLTGVWSKWSSYSSCSKSCGNGIRTKRRLCNSPPPRYGGRQCSGSSTSTIGCKIRDCPGKLCSIGNCISEISMID